MKSALFLILCPFVVISALYSQSYPDGYIRQYDQKFGSNKGLDDFWFNNPTQWDIFKIQGNYFLRHNKVTRPDIQAVALPCNRAILKNRVFGDFILEADVMPVTRGNAAAEICLFVGLKDSTKYYFILLSADPANEMEGIYLVKNSLLTKLPLLTSSSNRVIPNAWQKIRVERNIVKRTIRVFLGNPEQLLMEVKDYELVMGSVGIGSLGNAVCFDNISIWAPTMITDDTE